MPDCNMNSEPRIHSIVSVKRHLKFDTVLAVAVAVAVYLHENKQTYQQ